VVPRGAQGNPKLLDLSTQLPTRPPEHLLRLLPRSHFLAQPLTVDVVDGQLTQLLVGAPLLHISRESGWQAGDDELHEFAVPVMRYQPVVAGRDWHHFHCVDQAIAQHFTDEVASR
jgi:hypothetical protein